MYIIGYRVRLTLRLPEIAMEDGLELAGRLPPNTRPAGVLFTKYPVWPPALRFHDVELRRGRIVA